MKHSIITTTDTAVAAAMDNITLAPLTKREKSDITRAFTEWL